MPLRSLSKYESVMRRLGAFRVVHVLPNHEGCLKIGFEQPPQEGDSILPAPVGPITGFNASGKTIVRRDLPKQPESRMVWTSWKDWHGYPHSGIQMRSIEMYPRELVPPPSEELTVMQRGGQLVLASRELSEANNSSDEILHVVNLFLELFGELEIVRPNLDSPPDLRVRRLNWHVLPRGEFPFERAQEALNELLAGMGENERPVVEDRIRTITRQRPDFMAVGLGGFDGYVVFGFSDRNLYVLESPEFGNATYVFRDGWEEVSALTKREILAGDLHEARLIHNHAWATRINELTRARN